MIGKSLLLASFLSAVAQAAPRPDIPAALQPWRGWVLHGKESKLCPPAHDASSWEHCAYPSRLQLSIDKGGGRFSQLWRVYAPTRVPLVGDARLWPQRVKVDGKAFPVTQARGRPVVALNPGLHRVEGMLAWTEDVPSITVPAATGLVDLTIAGRVIAEPKLEGDKLFLQTAGTISEVASDSLDVRIYRQIVDDIPMGLETHLELTVTGKSREVRLAPVLPDGFIVHQVSAPIPARLEATGGLTLQARPGKWTVVLAAHHPTPVTKLSPPQSVSPLPSEELWVFVAREALRLVTIDGVTAVDPSQTLLPDAWKRLPAFHVPQGATMTFVEKRRGNPEPPPDQISLQRTLWLDFDGRGYSVRDRLEGRMTRTFRLEMPSPGVLGRVEVNGESQLITRSDTGHAGVELTRGNLVLNADSRIDGRRINAAGWGLDLSALGIRLELPPGWRLVAAFGADSSQGSWLTTWNLLNIFVLVLVVTVTWRLTGFWSALILAAALLLGLPEGISAPRYSWLALLPAMALRTARLPSFAQRCLQFYKLGAAIVLGWVAFCFCLKEVRLALYPVLARPAATLGAAGADHDVPSRSVETDGADRAEEPVPPSDDQGASLAPAGKTFGGGPYFGSQMSNQMPETPTQNFRMRNLQQRDPKANVQTGPGLPNWTWETVHLVWNGPVRHDQTLSLWLLPPWATRALRFLTALATLLGAMIMIWPRDQKPWRGRWSWPRNGVAAVFAVVALLSARGAAAQVPPADILEQLGQRLTAPPPCLPECASVPRLVLEVDERRLAMRLEVNADAEVAIPLPGTNGAFKPETVTVDGALADALVRDDEQNLWTVVTPGIHQIVLSGQVGQRDTLAIALPLHPGHVTFQGSGWDVDGLHENGTSDSSLTLSRRGGKSSGAEAATVQEQLTPVLRVDRTLSIGLDWLVETRVTRVSTSDTAVSLRVPLLPGERVTTSDIRVVNDQALINIGPRQSAVVFEGVIAPTPTLTLTAPTDATWTETWTVEASSIWHLAYKGLPVITQVDANSERRPHWQPWPGEAVMLDITRPEAVEGATVTIDRVEITVTPGARSSAVQMNLNVRASLGSDLPIKLPAAAEFQSMTIDGQNAAFQPVDGRLTIPLHPGSQALTISWRDGHGISLFFSPAPFDLGLGSVNYSVRVAAPRDRWILGFTGPGFGPALLFWGHLIFLLFVACLLGRSRLTPLRTWQWALLALGLTQTSLADAAVVACFIVLTAWRERTPTFGGTWLFDLRQLAIAILGVAAAVALGDALRTGFVGRPAMQIVGNGSYGHNLHWFVDRVDATTPMPTILSAPLLAYQIAMLAWALWLALTLVQLSRWLFTAMGQGGYWRPLPRWRGKRT